ncbi:hypothetical protein ACFL1E_06250 [Candidatus Omnitrophota bacterium]
MKRGLFITLIALINIICLASLCFAAGNPTSYKTTVQTVQLKSATTGSWITIASPNAEIDLVQDASGAGTVAASFATDVTIPVDTYDNFKLIISETMQVTGCDGTDCTATNGALTLNGNNVCAASTALWDTCGAQGIFTAGAVILEETADTYSNGSAGETTYTLNLHAEPTDGDNFIELYRNGDLTTPITVTATSVISMWFDFDTIGTVRYIGAPGGGDTDLGSNGITMFLPPQEGSAFSITVDGATSSITADNMRIDY